MEAMALSTKLIKRFEATTVYSHPKATADIVLVHGLNGSPDHTWTASNGVFWPSQLLGPTLDDAPANIIVYGYNADVATWKKDGSPTNNFVYQHAQNLVMSLATHRRNAGTEHNPIIWVCHSLGGIVTKRALLYANDVRDPELEICRSIYVSTYAMIFLGTPHTGSSLASWAHVLQGMSGVIPRKMFDSEPVLLKTLKKDNVVLQEINLHFLDIYRRFKIHMVRENRKTDLKWTVDFVVDANSAGPQLPGVTYYGIEATHSTMCKFGSEDAPGYSNVSSAIAQWVVEAPEFIQTRWRVEDEERTARAMNNVNEIVKHSGVPATMHTPHMGRAPPSYASDVFPVQSGGHGALAESPRSVSSMPSLEEPRPRPAHPLVIHPYRIRPNAHFKGRQNELAELHRNLKNETRRRIGTSAVLLQSLPGGGKSHLARQYVYLYGHEYRGGIYWIPSRSEQEMEEAFWKIAKAKTMHEFEAEPWKRELLDPKNMVETVRNWFESFDDWLIVFDGIHFDAPQERRFIPGTKNTSVLYTSTNRAAHGDHKFENPVLLELGRLSQHDARELLLEEMGKTPEFSANDLTQAGQAVDLMDRLPSMIHMAGQHLKVTREPLVKYINSFRDRRNAGTLDAYKSVREELNRRGEIEALNLVYILCFFAQNIPVEMVVLGLGALDNRTPVKAKDAANRRSLNNTLTVLIRYALIGRNESDDSSSAASSSSSRRSDPSLPEPSDTLRIHSIIQEFFVDTLIECKDAVFWLERSVNMFCHSYDSADFRIRQDPKLGLPEDYRQYSIHGKKLLDRLEQLGRKHPHLYRLRSPLEERLKGISQGIDELTKETLNGSINRGRSDQALLSIFEVSNSFSDSDSTKTSQGPTPGYDEMMEFDFLPQNIPDFVESPTVDPSLNVRQYETPYPPGDHFPMPKYPEDSGIGGDISTPQPRSSASSIWRAPTDPSQHRTVRKLEERRYHDRAGSMRQTAGDHADARINVNQEPVAGEISSPSIPSDSPSEQSPTGSARSRLLKISNTLSKQRKTPPGGEKPSPLWSLLKTFRKSPLASGDSSEQTQQDITASPPSVTIAPSIVDSEDDTRSKGNLTPATGASPVTRGSSHDSTTLQERLSRSDVVPGTAANPMWGDEPRRGLSVPPVREQGRSYISDEDLLSFPPDHPPTNPFSVDMPSWPTSLQPTGYTSQPMSRQTSDNPAARGRSVTPRSLPSGYATPRPRRRNPSQVETEPSPRLAVLESGSPQDWGERHARGGYVASVPGSRRGRGRTIGEYVGRPLGIEESPLSGGILTGTGFVAFGTEGDGGEASNGETREGQASGQRVREDTDEALYGVGLGIMGGTGGA